jgi:hypothetical protein
MKKPAQIAANIQAAAERWYAGEYVDETMRLVYAKFLAEVVQPALDAAYPQTKPKQKKRKR